MNITETSVETETTLEKKGRGRDINMEQKQRLRCTMSVRRRWMRMRGADERQMSIMRTSMNGHNHAISNILALI